MTSQTPQDPQQPARRAEQPPRPDQDGRNNHTVGIVAGILLALALVAGIGYAVVRQSSGHTGDTVAPAASGTTTSTATASTSAIASSKAGAVPAGCMATATPLVPTTMKIDGMGVSTKVLALGRDADGAAAAPPKNEPSTAAWYDEGPKPGSKQGKVLLSIHTYHAGGALGNTLYDSSKGIKKGDLIRLSDAQGHTMCYRYDHLTKIAVKDYDPNSDLVYDDAGKPQVVICICWDYDATKKDWDSRVLFYATPVTA
nr:class F sortase [Acidipropionibacterium timonense]